MHKGFLNVGLLLAVGISIFNAPAARAQDVIVGPMHWYYPEDEGSQPPADRKPPRVEYPEHLKGKGASFYVILTGYVSRDGKSKLVAISPQDGVLGWAVGEIMAESVNTDFAPAQRDKRKADARIWRALVFNGVTTRKPGQDEAARLLEVYPVMLPELSAGAKKFPRLRVNLDISATGAASLRSFIDSAPPSDDVVAAVKSAVAKWKFRPALRAGKPIESVAEQAVICLPMVAPDERIDWPPEIKSNPEPVLPKEFVGSGLRAEVDVVVTVTPDGLVSGADVEASNGPAFNRAALETAFKWRYEPARRLGHPVQARLKKRIFFRSDDSPFGGRIDSPISELAVSKLPPELQYDKAPKLLNAAPAVYPRELLERRVEGEAKVRFFIDKDGRVGDRVVVSSTQVEFVQATLAMLDATSFEPARAKGEATMSAMSISQKFVMTGNAFIPVDAQTKKVLSLLQDNKPIPRVEGHDGLPKMRARKEPVFPSALVGKIDHGAAVVEFYIDTDGTALLPRAVSASAEEFGYAAVQAVSQWKFERPLKGGRPVLVRAQVPIKFKLN